MIDLPFPPGSAVVIGGSGGVGSAICRRLAARGCAVAFTYRANVVAADRLIEKITEAGGRATAHRLDLTNRAMTTKFAESVQADVGRTHTLVLAAGADISMTYVADIDDDEWDATITADLTGAYNVIKAFLPALRAGGGSITAVTSAGLVRHPPLDILSTVPKAGVEAVVRGVAREEGRNNVRANAVALGVIDTGLFDRLRDRVSAEFIEAMRRNASLRRFGTAEEVAAAVVFLASPEAAFITGQSLAVDGGYSV